MTPKICLNTNHPSPLTRIKLMAECMDIVEACYSDPGKCCEVGLSKHAANLFSGVNVVNLNVTRLNVVADKVIVKLDAQCA